MRWLVILVALAFAVVGRAEFYDFSTITVQGTDRPSNGTTLDQAVSSDGRYVAFLTNKPHLRPKDDPASFDIFVFDNVTREYRWVNVDHFGFRITPIELVRFWGNESRGIHVSDNGDVAFEGYRAQFDSRKAIYLYSASQKKSRVVIDSPTINLYSLSTDARFVGIMNQADFTFKRFDTVTQSFTETASPYYSPDGQWHAFQTNRRDISPPFPLDKRYGLYAERIGTQERYLIYAGNLDDVCAVSNGAQSIAFSVDGTGVTASDTNPGMDSFVFNRVQGTFKHLSINTDGTPLTLIENLSFASNATAAVFRKVSTPEEPEKPFFIRRIDDATTYKISPNRRYNIVWPKLSASGRFVADIDNQNRIYSLPGFDSYLADAQGVRVPLHGTFSLIHVNESDGSILYTLGSPDSFSGSYGNLIRYSPVTGKHEQVFGKGVEAISPDCRWFVYTKFYSSDRPSELWLRNIKRKEDTFIAKITPSTPGYNLARISFSPDGRYLTYTTTLSDDMQVDANGNRPDVMLYSIGSRMKYLASKDASGKQYPYGATDGLMLSDGRSVVFSAYREFGPGDYYGNERDMWPVLRDVVANKSTVFPYSERVNSPLRFGTPFVSSSSRFLTYYLNAAGADSYYVLEQFDRVNNKWLDGPSLFLEEPAGFTVSNDREVAVAVSFDGYRLVMAAAHTSSGRTVRLDTYQSEVDYILSMPLAYDNSRKLIYHAVNGFLGTMRVRFPESP